MNSFPEFAALYRDIAEFRRKPEEVIGMFSETLRIMERDAALAELAELKAKLAEKS
ncbi:MAG: hypothetical protein J6N47_02015 [Lachnospiraceae bacterium]|nr:hypothetical protein [Lachnospiraceae bacterium]